MYTIYRVVEFIYCVSFFLFIYLFFLPFSFVDSEKVKNKGGGSDGFALMLEVKSRVKRLGNSKISILFFCHFSAYFSVSCKIRYAV